MIPPVLVPPVLLRLRVGKIRLWLPVILLWPLVPVAFVLWPFCAVVLAIVYRRRGWSRKSWLGFPYAYVLLCRLRGLTVEVGSHADKTIHISIS